VALIGALPRWRVVKGGVRIFRSCGFHELFVAMAK